MDIMTQNRLCIFFIQAVDLQFWMTDRIIFLHKFHLKKTGICIIGNSQMTADIRRIHALVFSQIMVIGLHLQIMFVILFL